MIASTLYPAPGTEVGCEYRWPYDHAHPDCWQKPHKGVVLALDDPRAWRNSLAFPATMYPDGPPQDKLTAHVEKCLSNGLLTSHVPVLYVNTLDGTEFIQWDSKLRPYADELTAWNKARDEKRATYK